MYKVLLTKEGDTVAVEQNGAILVTLACHEQGLLDHQATNAVRDEEERARRVLPFAASEDILQQVPSKALERGVVGQLAMPVEHDPRRVRIPTDALSDPQVGGLGEVAADAWRQDGISSQLLDSGMGGQVVLVSVAEEIVRKGVSGPCLDRVRPGTRHGDDIGLGLVVTHAADLSIYVGESRLRVPMGHARPVRRLMLVDADCSQLALDQARARGGLGRVVQL